MAQKNCILEINQTLHHVDYGFRYYSKKKTTIFHFVHNDVRSHVVFCVEINLLGNVFQTL